MLTRPNVHDLVIIRYQRRDRRAARVLFERSYLTHVHLDWQERDHWLDTEPPLTWTAWRGTRMVGLLSMSEIMGGVSWIRLTAIDHDGDYSALFNRLWQHALPELRAAGIRQVALLILNDWITPHAARHGFTKYDEVVTFRRETPFLPAPDPSPFRVRGMNAHELPTLIRIDQSTFVPPWQMSSVEIRAAERAASNVTVALLDQEVIGYQINTFFFDGAHLARLAVLPQYQGQGVGRALVYDMIARFARRGVYTISVNTQLSNIQSQNLYRRFDFTRTGYDMPVWMLDL
jgi:ribosomal-protein-alanine N-acetyltransferase